MEGNDGNECEEDSLSMPMSVDKASLYIVDDDLAAAKTVSLHMARLGYRTRILRSSKAAVSAFAMAVCKPALLICDFSMPGLNGLQLMQQCNALCPRLKTIIVGWSLAEELLRRQQLGPVTVLKKPVTRQALTAALATLGIPSLTESPGEPSSLMNGDEGESARDHEGAETGPLVYVVDDKINVAEMIATALGRSDYRTAVFQSPAAAVAALALASPKPSLLIADFSMPEMDGLELIRRCKQLCPSLKVILVSGTVSAKVLRGSCVDADVVLNKPLSLRHLSEAVQSLHDPAAPPSNHGLQPQKPESQLRHVLADRPLVYVVDDEFVIAQLVSRQLLRAGYRTRAFESPVLALSSFSSAATKPALLIADLEMPLMHGTELMRRCRELCSGLKVIVMSQSSPVDTASLNQSPIKADGILRKPFTPERLLYEVEALIDPVS